MASRITSQEQTHCHKCHGEVLCQDCEAEVALAELPMHICYCSLVYGVCNCRQNEPILHHFFSLRRNLT